MEAGLLPLGCTPNRDSRASQCCAWPCNRASSQHAKCHLSSSHCAGFSSPCFRFEGRITLMLEIQHPWCMENCISFLQRRMGAERAYLLFPMGALPHHDIGLGGG